MKVLYIAHYRENSGWGDAAINYIRALSIYCDVVIRPVIIKGDRQLPLDITLLENKTLNGVTHTIQNVLPNHMSNNPYTKNVGLWFSDTYHPELAGWLPDLDQVWGPYPNMPGATHCVPCTVNTSIYDIQYEQPHIPEINGKYKFYFIGEFTKRKNLAALFTAFHKEFSADDNAALILKCNKSNVNPADLVQQITEVNSYIKSRLYLTNRESPVIITERLTNEQLYGLHQYADCFVNPSYGDAWNMPLFDAMAFNKICISSRVSGPASYLKNYLIDCRPEHCYNADQFIPGLHTGLDEWDAIDTKKLGNTMRHIYETQPTVTNDISRFSYESVGQLMIRNLNEI